MPSPAESSNADSPKGKARERALEPLHPLVSAALERGAPSLAARLERLERQRPAHARYTQLGEIARGGMGRVLRAWDEELACEVAMKVVPRAAPPGSSEEACTDHERRLARFLDEARITGQLDHPGIVPVYEIGLDERGDVFFTMPLLRGRELKQIFGLVHRGEEGWTLQRAVSVMHAVCLTLAFAHQKGVVHRDLKPENIMVGPYGEAYVMDWGLALLVGRKEERRIVGTPAYMAPEQAAGDAVDRRADVYSLGAILYELLTRRRPHEASLEDRGDRSEPFEDLLSRPPRPLKALRRDVPDELAAIASKAMASAPAARYPDALQMAADLQAWLEGRVVSALEAGPLARWRKWRARNRSLALTLDAVAVLVFFGALVFVVQERSWLREVQARHAEMRVSAYSAALSAADLGLRAHEADEARRRLARCEEDLRGWEWRHLALRADTSTAVLRAHDGTVRAVAVSPDGRWLASGGDDGLRLWPSDGGTPPRELVGHADSVTALAFAPDGALLASVSRDEHLRLWRVADGSPALSVQAHEADIASLAFSADGRVVYSGDVYGTVVASATSGGERLAEWRPSAPDGVVGLACVGSSGVLAAGYLTGFVRLHGPDLAVQHEARVARSTLTTLTSDAEGTRLAVAFERSALVLDATTLAAGPALTWQGSRAVDLAFAPGGALLASAGSDSVVRLWNLATGLSTAEFDGHSAEVNSVAFFPDGRRLVTGSEDRTLRLWDLDRTAMTVLARGGRWFHALAFAPDGTRLLLGGNAGGLRLFELGPERELAGLPLASGIDCVAWSPTGAFAFGCGLPEPHLARLGDLEHVERLPAGKGFPKAMAFAPNGAELYVRDSLGLLRALEVASGRILAERDLGEFAQWSLALSPEGTCVAVGSADGGVQLLAARTLALLAHWKAGEHSVTTLAFAPDGARLAVGFLDGAIRLLATADGTTERVLDGHEGWITCLAFHPSGARLVSGSTDRTLRLWDPEGDGSLLVLRGHTDQVTAAAFDPRGEILATAAKDASVRLWRTTEAFVELAPAASRSK